ncbi:MAG: hypothetical protein JWQ98_1278 [Chlorobi bacterium]|nr:hypothetical protein [Chlorobiota bacterium]
MNDFFYPKLSGLISLDALPEQLNFVKDGFEAILDSIYFKDFRASHDLSGGVIVYNLDLVAYKQVGFEIPGTEIDIVLNPAFTTADPITVIPLSVVYNWPIRRLLSSFDIATFSGAPSELFSIAFNVSGIAEEELLRLTVALLVVGTDPLTTFANHVNTQYSANISLPLDSDVTTAIQSIVDGIADNSTKRLDAIVFDDYVLDAQSVANSLDNIESLFRFDLGEQPLARLRELLIPRIDARLGIDVGIKFPPSVLGPVTGGNQIITTPGGRFQLVFDGGVLEFSTDGGIGYSSDITVHCAPYPKAQIGHTGIIIGFDTARLDLSRTTNIPEADAEGRPSDFVGLFVASASVILPAFWHHDDGNSSGVITGKNLLVGTGGFSGTLSMEAKDQNNAAEPILKAKLGEGFELDLNAFTLAFRQNSIVGSEVKGSMKVPGFKDANGTDLKLDVDIHIRDNEFTLTAGNTAGINVIRLPEVFSITVRELSLGTRGDDFFIGVSGTIKFDELPGVIGDFLPKEIDISKLVIWSNGEFEFEGGGLTLPKSVGLKVGPVELSVSALHMGSVEQSLGITMRRYKYFGFDGGIKSGLGGVDAHGKGIKYYFTVDDDSNDGRPHNAFMKIESLEIDIMLPGNVSEADAAVILKGWLAMTNHDDQGPEATASLTEYAGGITLKLPKLDIEGGAAMRITPSTGAFLVDADLELSSPILVGNTGLGIYGFRGTIGNKYVLSKKAAHVAEDATWWEAYRAPKLGINVDKFEPRDGFSFGAGLTLATVADSGQAFSSRLFFLLSLPRVFLLEGQAAILSKRLGFDTPGDPPFYAAIIISDESIEAGFGVHMMVPSSGDFAGKILDLSANLELAFYWRQASAWHLYVGRNAPAEKRVSALLFNIFNAYAYLMISSKGISAGAGVEWHVEKSFGGIAKVGLGASLDMAGSLSFKPVQIGGYIKLSGYAELKVFGIGFRLDVGATLGAEAPKPFTIYGEFYLKIKTPWPLPDINISASLSWNINPNVDDDPIGFVEVAYYTGNAGERLVGYLTEGRHAAKALHMVTQEPFVLNFVNSGDPHIALLPDIGDTTDGKWIGDFGSFLIPLDCFVDIDFSKGVKGGDGASIALLGPMALAENSEKIPPQPGRSRQVEHKYTVRNVSVKYWDSGWHDYEMWVANTPLIDVLARSAGGNAVLADLQKTIHDNVKYGWWQMTEAGKYSKLRLLARTPLSQSVNIRPADAGFPKGVILCPDDPLPMQCQNWSPVTFGASYAAGGSVTDRKLHYRITGTNGVIASFPNLYELPHSLAMAGSNRIEIDLPSACTKFSLKLSTFGDKVTISYYRGQAYTPAVGNGGGGGAVGPDGVMVARWEAAPVEPATPAAKTTIWSRLRSFGAMTRLLCTGGEPVAAEVADITAALDRFAYIDVYLRQYSYMTDPELLDPQAQRTFCWRLCETLRTLITAYTGKDGIPEYLAEDVAHFYDELNGYVADYRLAKQGMTLPAPSLLANSFYEKWMELLTCLGDLCDRQWTLPAHINRLRQGLVDGRINELYVYIIANVVTANMELDAWANLTSPCDQLRYLAAVFAWITVDLSLVTQSLFDKVDPYFRGLEDAYITIKRAMASDGSPLCSDASCWRASQFVEIAQLLCRTAPATPLTATLTAIESLVNGFEGTLGSLAIHLNYTLPAPGTTFCGRLRRALVVVIAGYAVLDLLPFDLRYPTVQFYKSFSELADRHRVDIRGHEVAPPNPDPLAASDTFIAEWNDIIACLCNLCTLSLTAGQAAQVASTFDAQLDLAYGEVVKRARTEGLPVFGYKRASNIGAYLQAIMNFFVQAALQCGGPIDTVVTGLAADYTALNGAFTAPGALRDAINANGLTYCAAGPQALPTPCGEWLEITDAILQILDRRVSAGASVLAALDTDNMYSALKDLYFLLYGFNSSIPPTERIDKIWYLNMQIHAWLLQNCLTNAGISPSTQSQFAQVHDVVRGAVDNALSLLDDAGMNFIHGVGADGVGTDECARRLGLVDIGRTLCATTPNLALAPIAAIISLVNQNAELFEQLADEMDMPRLATPVAATTAAEFCAMMGQVIGMLSVGYGFQRTLALRTLALMKTFYADLKTQAGLYLAACGVTVLASACKTSCDSWLDLLKCLCETQRYRYDLTPTIEVELELLSPQVETIYNKVMDIAIERGIQIEPRQRAGDRCWKIRAMGTYIAMKSLSYADVASVLIPMLNDPASVPNLTGLKTAYTTLKGQISGMCPVKQDTPYDPLRKREVRQQFDLLREVKYENPDEPIDRVVIESSVSCNPTAQPPNWQQTYWGNVQGYLLTSLIPALQQMYNDAVVEVQVQEVINRESAAAYDARDARDAAQAELARAQRFLATLPHPNDSSLLPCGTYLHEICWLSPAVYRYNKNLPKPHETRSGATSLDLSLKNLTQPIWRPNTTFAIQIETLEEISGRGPDHRFYTFGFRTAGPVGHFHKIGDGPGTVTRPEYAVLEAASKEGVYPYATLRSYIDYQRSYPRPDGNVINAKPLYYRVPKLTLYYEQNYLQSMYGQWRRYNGLKYVYSDIEIVIKDPAKTGAGSSIVLGTSWEKDPHPRLAKDVLMFNRLISNVTVRGKHCVQFTPIQKGDPPASRTVNKLVSLEPEKMYTAVFNALFGELNYDPENQPNNDPANDPHVVHREVHKYVFKTSRYADFAEHIGSYHLGGEGVAARHAVHALSVDEAQADLAAAANIIARQDQLVPAELIRDYADRFDRLITGALRLDGLDAAATLEFNAVKKGNGTIIGLLVRSPEPINDPQIPDNIIQNTVTMQSGATSPVMIWSKDRTSFFVTSSPPFTTGSSVTFRFEYWEYNGDDYAPGRQPTQGGDEPVSPVTVTITIP